MKGHLFNLILWIDLHMYEVVALVEILDIPVHFSHGPVGQVAFSPCLNVDTLAAYEVFFPLIRRIVVIRGSIVEFYLHSLESVCFSYCKVIDPALYIYFTENIFFQGWPDLFIVSIEEHSPELFGTDLGVPFPLGLIATGTFFPPLVR